MAIETIGKYQAHLIAIDAGDKQHYAPFVTISRFDDAKQDFVIEIEKARAAGDDVFDTVEAAEEAARRYANLLIENELNPDAVASPSATTYGDLHAHHTRSGNTGNPAA